MSAKSWYSVKLLFVSDIPGNPEPDRLCEESIIVVEGTSDADVRSTAEQTALTMQHAYANEAGEDVEWRFVRILEIQDLCEQRLESGTEVYARLFRESQAIETAVIRSLREATLAPS